MNSHTLKHIAACVIALSVIVISRSYSQGTVAASGQGDIIARPSSPESVLGQVKIGSVLTVLQIEKEWVKVALTGKKIGWVRRDIVTLPDPDKVTIGRDWPLFGSRGNWNEPWDTTGPKVGRVSKGMTARRLLLQAEWYELELPGGTSGWVPQHVVEPSIMERATVKRSWTLVSDTSRKRNDARAGVQIDAGVKLIQLERGIKWVKVRTPEGKEGWLESFKLEVEGGLPVEAQSVFWYRTFDSLDKLGDKHFLLGMLVFFLHWIVIPILPGILIYFPYYFSIGPIKLFNNWFVKGGYAVVAFLVGSWFIMFFLPSVPPFTGGFTGGIMQLWSFLIMLGVIPALMHRISYDRCNNCRRIGAGEVQGAESGGVHTSIDTTKTTYGYADGHTSTETKETTTTSHTTWVTVQCRHCGFRWKVRETSSSRRTSVK